MTEMLYLKDAYTRSASARVQEISENGVILDRTPFYPGGGGQPSDLGWLRTASGLFQVTKLVRQEGRIWHQLDVEGLGVGVEVEAEIDWDRRYSLMRTHTAMHILCGVIWRDYQASVTGGNMEPLSGRMDFEFEHMQKDLVAEIEEKINLEVQEDRPVRIKTLPREEAFQIPDLIRTKINLLPKGISEVRTVEIAGLDLQADGGTHVSSTKEVGNLLIFDYKSKGRINKRLVVTLQEVR